MTQNSLFCTVTEFASISASILRLGKSLRFRARGHSMQPLVRHGDTLLIQPVEASQIHPGDVVLCSTRANCLVVHRVLRKRSSPAGIQYFVQGDQATQPDGWVPMAHIYGKLVSLEREGLLIGMEHPSMRLLSTLAAVRSRWGLGRKGLSLAALRWLKSLPIFIGYLY